MVALALIGLANAFGSVTAGWLGGRFSKKHLLAAIYLVRGAIIVYLLLVPLTPMTLYVFAVSMGLLWLSTVPLTTGLVGQIFGLRYMATLTGVVFFGHQIGSFLGVWLAGYLYDTTGSYNGAFMVSIGLSIFAALVNLPVDQRPIAHRRATAAA
jgi:MFS family permease